MKLTSNNPTTPTKSNVLHNLSDVLPLPNKLHHDQKTLHVQPQATFHPKN